LEKTARAHEEKIDFLTAVLDLLAQFLERDRSLSAGV
jgi:hypothetical protein